MYLFQNEQENTTQFFLQYLHLRLHREVMSRSRLFGVFMSLRFSVMYRQTLPERSGPRMSGCLPWCLRVMDRIPKSVPGWFRQGLFLRRGTARYSLRSGWDRLICRCPGYTGVSSRQTPREERFEDGGVGIVIGSVIFIKSYIFESSRELLNLGISIIT